MATLLYPLGQAGKTAWNILKQSKRLTHAVGLGGSQSIWRLHEGGKIRMHALPVLDAADIHIIRYGWRGSLPRGTVGYQDTRGMSIAANKLAFRQWAVQNDVTVPLTWIKPSEPEDISFPVLARPTHHRKGEQYIILPDRAAYDKLALDGYYSTLLEKDAEYRVYTFEGYAWCVSKKNPTDGVGPLDPWNFSIGNSTFKILRNSEWGRTYCQLAMRACSKLKLLFAGVDVIMAGGKPYIVEINTAPGLQGKLKPENFGFLMDNLLERLMAGETPNIIDPSSVKRVRHPALSRR